MEKLNIEVISPVFSKIQGEKYFVRSIADKIKESNIISFQKEFWRKTWGKGKVKQLYLKHMISNDGIFLTGLVNIVADFLTDKGYDVEIIEVESIENVTCIPNMGQIVLREDQEDVRKEACYWGTGVVKAPTGKGKTIIAASIINSYSQTQGRENFKVLFLCHTITLLNQTAKEFEEKVGIKTCRIGGGSKDTLNEKVVVGTIQSVSKIVDNTFFDQFKMVIVDEAHHLSKEDSLYYKTLLKINAPFRFGFTATIPSAKEGKLILEGLIGPVIGNPDIKKDIDNGLLAKPFLKLIVVPKDNIEEKKYQEIYDKCIVNNLERNLLIRDEAIKLAKEGSTCLIYVNKIAHIDNLISLFNKEVNVKTVYGATSGDERELLRQDLQKKKIQIVIATVVWKEGVNIPSLDSIIIAGGGKAEIAVLQTIGRGLRTFEGKDRILIIDFLDSEKYLASHCLERIRIYTGENFQLSGTEIINYNKEK